LCFLFDVEQLDAYARKLERRRSDLLGRAGATRMEEGVAAAADKDDAAAVAAGALARDCKGGVEDDSSGAAGVDGLRLTGFAASRLDDFRLGGIRDA
jgi:hypothetical protein